MLRRHASDARGIDQRAVDREVVRGQQLLLAGQIDDLIEKASGHVGGDKAFAQAAEVRLVQRKRSTTPILT